MQNISLEKRIEQKYKVKETAGDFDGYDFTEEVRGGVRRFDMKKALETIVAFIGMVVVTFITAYALVYAWDLEAERQEQKEIEYMYERGLR